MKRYRVQAAHAIPNLPKEDPESRIHGHGFMVEIYVEGPVDERYGWVVDFGDITASFKPLFKMLDHHYLNEVEGLENPTAKEIARWIYQRMKPALELLDRVEVHETTERVGVYPS